VFAMNKSYFIKVEQYLKSIGYKRNRQDKWIIDKKAQWAFAYVNSKKDGCAAVTFSVSSNQLNVELLKGEFAVKILTIS